MRVKNVIKAVVLILVVILISCEDILVEDISNKQINVIAPADSVQTYQKQQTFLWESMPGAVTYELFIFSPDLATASTIVVDTILSQTTFKFELPAASYEWCVKGSNGAYETELVCHKLIVKESLSDQDVTLVSPQQDQQNNKATQLFLWNVVPGASSYNLIIVSPDLTSVNEIVLDTVLSKTTLSWNLPVGKYEWCVTASDGQQATPAVCNKLEVIK